MNINANFTIDFHKGTIQIEVNHYNNKTDFSITAKGVDDDGNDANVHIKEINEADFEKFVGKLESILNIIEEGNDD